MRLISRRAARRLLAGAAAIGVAMGLVLAPGAVQPASAASSGILISADGAHWSDRLSANVFDTSRKLVPGDTLKGAFYVKNDRDSPAYLRVGLSALSVTNWALAEALSLTTIGTGASGASGSAAGFSGSGVVCSDLLQREDPIPPGGVVLVSADLLFRQSTSGTNAQGEIAQIGFIVELSDVDLNVFGQPLCTNTIRIGDPDPSLEPTPDPHVTPPSGGGGSDPSAGTGPADGGLPGGIDGAGGAGGGAGTTPGGAGTATSGDSTFGSGRPLGGAFDRPASSGTISVDGPIALDGSFFNTVRWWEEYAILVLIGAALLGMLGRVYVEKWVTARARSTSLRVSGQPRMEQA